MDLDRNKHLDPNDPMRSEADLRPLELETNPAIADRDGRGSSFLAFLLGGVVIAIGLLAFVFYPSGTSNEVDATGSTTPRVERPASPSPAAPATPSSPAAPAPAPASPAPTK